MCEHTVGQVSRHQPHENLQSLPSTPTHMRTLCCVLPQHCGLLRSFTSPLKGSKLARVCLTIPHFGSDCTASQ